jgi:hypothetical protein
LCRLFNQLRAQAIDLLIDRLFNLRERRSRMGHSPLRDGGSGFLSLLFPPLLQVFGLHLGLSLLDCLYNSFPLRQCTTGWLNPTTL